MSENPGCLGRILRLFGVQPAKAPELPYRQRDDFLSQAELSFYRTLTQAVGQRAVVLAKVNLADIFFVLRPNENQAYRNKIDRKHVDFLLCDPATMRPVLGVELDDSSHRRADRQGRDAFIDEVFSTAGIPLMRVPVRRSYEMAALSRDIGEILIAPGAPSQSAASAPIVGDAAPACPRCGGEMVLRSATRGPRQGESFYGCSNYPKCRGTLPYASDQTRADRPS